MRPLAGHWSGSSPGRCRAGLDTIPSSCRPTALPTTSRRALTGAACRPGRRPCRVPAAAWVGRRKHERATRAARSNCRRSWLKYSREKPCTAVPMAVGVVPKVEASPRWLRFMDYAAPRRRKAGLLFVAENFKTRLMKAVWRRSSRLLKANPGLAKNYEIGEKYIRTKDGRIDFTFVGLRRNIESVKSTARIRLLVG